MSNQNGAMPQDVWKRMEREALQRGHDAMREYAQKAAARLAGHLMGAFVAVGVELKPQPYELYALPEALRDNVQVARWFAEWRHWSDFMTWTIEDFMRPAWDAYRQKEAGEADEAKEPG